MKKNYLLLGCLAAAGLITGSCGIMILDGAPPPSYSPSAYSDSWKKPGVSEEQKQEDWVACGGRKNKPFDPPYNRKFDGDPNISYIKKAKKFQHCLIGKGYRWTGQCIYNMPKFEPACGAP